MIPTTGPLSMTMILNEAGLPISNRNLNFYALRFLAQKITADSTIKYSDFRGKSRIVADFIMVTYTFTDGNDMDTRTRVVVPTSPSNAYVGYGFPSTQGSYLTFGGDNTGVGEESALINIAALKTELGNPTTVKIDCRAMWWGTKGFQPVKIQLTLWQGGTPVKSGFVWTNPTATNSLIVSSAGEVLDLQSNDANNIGERIGILVYDLSLGAGYVDETDASVY